MTPRFPRPISWRLGLCLFTGALILLGGCGERERAERAERGARWLKAYTSLHPPGRGWRITAVRVSDNLDVEMDVLIPDPSEVKALRAHSRMEQVAILQRLCPPRGAKIWKILEVDQALWANLKSRRRKITAATCKRA